VEDALIGSQVGKRFSRRRFSVVFLSLSENARIILQLVSLIMMMMMIIIIMALQPFVGPWPLFQLLDPIHSR
jgi:hypothetical protein